VAADDGGGLDVAVNGAVLGVADALAAALVELVATGHGAAEDGGIGLEGDAYQAELQRGTTSRPIPRSHPARARSLGLPLSPRHSAARASLHRCSSLWRLPARPGAGSW